MARVAVSLTALLLTPAPLPGEESRPQSAAYTDRGEIVLGMSTALTGPARELGLSMQRGVLLALDETNADGGVGGRRLRLVALDDGYEPRRTIPNMRQLIDAEGVLAIVGNVGTPTATVAVPLVNAARVPLVGAYTGAAVLRRNPPDRYVVNYRASYEQELYALIEYMVSCRGVRVDRIAFFTQTDAFGNIVYTAGTAALHHSGLPEGATPLHVRYRRNTLDVEGPLARILDAAEQPDAIILIGAHRPCARFIRLAKEFGCEPLFAAVSFVGTEPFTEALGSLDAGVIVTQVVPPLDSDLPMIREYRDCLDRYGQGAPPSATSLEGYIVTRILLAGIRRAKTPLTRKGVVDGLESLQGVDLGLGFPVDLNAGDHQVSDAVWASEIREGEIFPLGDFKSPVEGSSR